MLHTMFSVGDIVILVADFDTNRADTDTISHLTCVAMIPDKNTSIQRTTQLLKLLNLTCYCAKLPSQYYQVPTNQLTVFLTD